MDSSAPASKLKLLDRSVWPGTPQNTRIVLLFDTTVSLKLIKFGVYVSKF